MHYNFLIYRTFGFRSGRLTEYWCDAQKTLDFAFAHPYNVFCAVQQYRQPKAAGTDRRMDGPALEICT